MSTYYPDNWVVIKIMGDDPHYRVLAGWSGSYLQGDSWQLNSGITHVGDNDEGGQYIFYGASGSAYFCNKETYGLRNNNAYIWNKLKAQHGDKVELMPEDTDWMEMDWIIG